MDKQNHSKIITTQSDTSHMKKWYVFESRTGCVLKGLIVTCYEASSMRATTNTQHVTAPQNTHYTVNPGSDFKGGHNYEVVNKMLILVVKRGSGIKV